MKANDQLRRKLDYAAYIVSAAVILLVIYMRPAQRVEVDMDLSFLPLVHAIINSVGALFLLAALYFIKNKNIIAHRNMIYGAMVCSFFFLVSYVIYHFTNEETKFCKEGTIRYLYFFVLITHIILAGVSLPFILLTFSRGFTYMVEQHKKMAKWVYPVWLYVMLTGPLVYLMLKPCYN